MKQILNSKGVNNMQIFMNLLIPIVQNEILNCPLTLTPQVRQTFEKKINNLILQTIQSYPVLSSQYQEQNNRALKIELTSIKSIIHELNSPSQYNPNEYPNINYFYLSSLPSEKEIRQQMDSMENQYKMYLYYFPSLLLPLEMIIGYKK